ncbi:acyl carrier protein [Marinifilum sp. JC120]|nr:acyl carrier protein [Marinifilum sp. JC120]
MKYSDFYKSLEMAIDTTEDIGGDTVLSDLESYDSLAILGIIAMTDGSFGKKLTTEDFAKVTTAFSLIEIIGQNYFEED